MKGFKPRASQLLQQRYEISTAMHRISEELLSGSDWKPEARSKFTFVASEVEVYSVLSVAQPGDAVWLLSKGVRSAEDAADSMRGYGAEDKMLRRTIITAEALRRGISSLDFMMRMRLAVIANPVDGDDLRVMDVLELSTISSLDEQWGWAAREVRNGLIRLEDIKYLGVSKLKSRRRLVSIIEALQAVHEPETKFSMEDLKYLVDKGARDSLPETHFKAAVEYLVAEGVGGLKKTDSLKMIRSMSVRHYDDKRLQRVSYEIDFRAVYKWQIGVPFPEKGLIELFDAGVPADKAAELMNEGLPVGSVIGVSIDSVEKPLAGGWL
jgi:hypothetical protein